MTDLDYTNKTVLVVGGSSGIGNGIAQSFRARGAIVHVWGTRPTAADYEASEGCDLTGLNYACVNVEDRDRIDVEAARIGVLDVLVLSQGTVVYKRAEFHRAGWDHVMAVNLDSLMACSMAFKEKLAAVRGTIIVVSSTSGFQSNIGNPAYSASKAGAISLTATLGKAWGRDGVRVNGIAPGLVETKLTKVTTMNAKRLESALNSTPAGRQGYPEDMANAALFLASPLASFIIGHTLVVDGGLSLN